MKGYFLQATKDLLKAEGLKSVSVRTIAERAGYSYATMYSYFRDINDLVFLCVRDFYEECRLHVLERPKKKEKGLDSLRSAIRAYVDFFIQYPGIFDLFFIEDIGSFKDKKTIVDLVSFSIDGICEEEWNYCMSHGLIAADHIGALRSQVRSQVYGLLMLYLKRRMPPSYAEFIQQLNNTFDAILVGGGKSDPATRQSGSNGPVTNNSLITIKVGNNK